MYPWCQWPGLLLLLLPSPPSKWAWNWRLLIEGSPTLSVSPLLWTEQVSGFFIPQTHNLWSLSHSCTHCLPSMATRLYQGPKLWVEYFCLSSYTFAYRGCKCCCPSLIPRISPPPVFDRLQYAKTQKLEAGEAWEWGYCRCILFVQHNNGYNWRILANPKEQHWQYQSI